MYPVHKQPEKNQRIASHSELFQSVPVCLIVRGRERRGQIANFWEKNLQVHLFIIRE